LAHGRRKVAIVGAGASGVIAAVRLLTTAEERRIALDVLLVDPAKSTGRGVAYSTRESSHVLNVPVGTLSAVAGDPDHFLRWARIRLGRDVEAGEYLPRRYFGTYLDEVLEETEQRGGTARLRRVRERAVGAERRAGGIALSLSSGAVVEVQAALLAIGVFPPGCDWAPAEVRASSRFVRNPWAPGALASISDTEDVLLVGTGLTMVDMALALDRPQRTLHAVSRHGLLPRRHSSTPVPDFPAPDLSDCADLESLRGAVLQHVRTSARDGLGWRAAIDSFRPVTARVWSGLSEPDQERFLGSPSRLWEIHRHRMAPAVADQIRRIRTEDRLLVRAGQVLTGETDRDGLRVVLSDGRAVRVGAVVNCTGPERDPRAVRDPLLSGLLDSGLARAGPHGLGLDTAEDGRLRTAGPAAVPLWTLGSLRAGNLWETNAFPEIREQADVVADGILSLLDAPKTTRKPRDRYGLPLSTTRQAAEAFNEGVDRILRGQHGALERFADAVAADPGFVVGHATIALLGHEWGAPVDVASRMRSAVDAGVVRTDEREQSFVAAVTARMANPAAGGRALLSHIVDHPRDALAISVAVPTIAFGGITRGKDSWSLVESLGRTYGDDWWYSSQLAFVRQEQERWEEAETLAAGALAEEPASGHAVHARAHVFYETGAHRPGLAWIDQWIRQFGASADGRAHFSWHAALHELMLVDDTAVRRRYARDLAPPSVTGARVLVDSASLLWRCEVTGRPDDEAEVEPLLEAAPAEWLVRPPSPFAAMHAAIAFAAAHDADSLVRLQRHARDHTSSTFAEVVAPLCAGLAAIVEQRWTTAVDMLRFVRPKLSRVGGSDAQREVVEDTLVHALIRAGRQAEAADMLSARLDRRPSPLDELRLSELPVRHAD
jgi:uncharacterized NAD(P)/FAD-binding protein YdhS